MKICWVIRKEQHHSGRVEVLRQEEDEDVEYERYIETMHIFLCGWCSSVHLFCFVPPIKNSPGIKKLNYHYPADIIIIIIIISSSGAGDLVVKGARNLFMANLTIRCGSLWPIPCHCLALLPLNESPKGTALPLCLIVCTAADSMMMLTRSQ